MYSHMQVLIILIFAIIHPKILFEHLIHIKHFQCLVYCGKQNRQRLLLMKDTFQQKNDRQINNFRQYQVLQIKLGNRKIEVGRREYCWIMWSRNAFLTDEKETVLCTFGEEHSRQKNYLQAKGLLVETGLPVLGFPDSSVGKESTCNNAGDPGSIPGSGRSAGEGIGYPLQYSWASLVAQLVKIPPAMRETWVRSLGQEDPLAKGKATHSSILVWRIPWAVQSMGSQRVGHD